MQYTIDPRLIIDHARGGMSYLLQYNLSGMYEIPGIYHGVQWYVYIFRGPSHAKIPSPCDDGSLGVRAHSGNISRRSMMMVCNGMYASFEGQATRKFQARATTALGVRAHSAR